MNIYKIFVRSVSALITVTIAASWFLGGTAFAAGTASLSVSPSSGSYTTGNNFSVTIHENSGSTAINAVETVLAYNPSQLQFVSSTLSSAFDFTPQNSGSNGLVCIVASKLATALTNDQTVATVTFRALSAGSSSLNFISGSNGCSGGSNGSAIITQSGAQNIWNGQTAGATFTLKNPSNTSTSAPTPAGTATPSTNPKTSSSSTASGANATPTVPAATSSNPKTTSPSVLAAISSGYMVAIKVTDASNNPLKGVKVTIDDANSAITDATGVASFVNIKPGKHTVKSIVNGKTKTEFIEVKGVTSAAAQQFSIQSSPKSNSYVIPALIGAAILVILLLVGVILWRRLGSNTNYPDKMVPPLINGGTITGSGSPEVITSDGAAQSQASVNPQAPLGQYLSHRIPRPRQ